MGISDRSTGQTSSPSTSSAAATRASPSVTRDRVRASLIRAIYGQRLHDAFAIYDLDGCYWKTLQGTFHWASGPFSETWPRSGMMRSGIAYPQRPSAPRTFAIACSSWRGELLPTKTATPYGTSNNGTNAGRPSTGKGSLETMAARGLLATPTRKANQLSPSMMKWPGCRAIAGLIQPGQPGRLSPLFVEWMMGFPLQWTRLDSED